MLLTGDVLKDMVGTIALMALLAVSFGTVMRKVERLGLVPVLARVGLGALFGGAAIFAMLSPVQVAPGAFSDVRSVPLVLAGAFLGLPGAVVATIMAVAMRVGIGGVGMIPGSAGIVLSGLGGLAWAYLHRRRSDRERRSIILLAALSPLYLLTTFLLPWDLAWRSVTGVWPFLAPFNLAGVLAVGFLLERERRMAGEAKLLASAAARDPLTGLLNRRGFEAAVLHAPSSSWGAAVLVLDLDRFKHVNDTYGHAAGDAVLCALGPRLREALGTDAIIARFGGEEVVVFLTSLGPNVAKAAADRLCTAVHCEPFALQGGAKITVTASVGGAWGKAPVGVDELAGRAEAALRAAKRAGRDCWRFADEEAAAAADQERRRAAA